MGTKKATGQGKAKKATSNRIQSDTPQPEAMAGTMVGDEIEVIDVDTSRKIHSEFNPDDPASVEAFISSLSDEERAILVAREQKRRERMKEAQKAYRLAHPDKVREKARKQADKRKAISRAIRNLGLLPSRITGSSVRGETPPTGRGPSTPSVPGTHAAASQERKGGVPGGVSPSSTPSKTTLLPPPQGE